MSDDAELDKKMAEEARKVLMPVAGKKPRKEKKEPKKTKKPGKGNKGE
jgi:hypothetical protein